MLSVLVLGAGFGGLELSTTLSEALGDEVAVTLVDKGDAFVFGYSKLDVMFGRTTLDAVRLPYRDVVKPGVRFVQETITAIDPEARRVTTDAGVHEADVLVVALGADYDLDATPGLVEADEFYSVAGAQVLAEKLPDFASGRVVIGVCGAPFKCPPAPSECALLLHDQLTARGVRGDCEITFTIPLPSPVPPSPETSSALLKAFAERDIGFAPGRRIASLDAGRGVGLELLGSLVQRPGDLGDRELVGVLVEQESEDGRLDLAIGLDWGNRIALAIRRVAFSHEEHCLLVVRPSVGVDAPPGAASWGRYLDTVSAAAGRTGSA